MKFNFNLKTIVFVLLIILFSVIFLYNMMPSYMEGFKEGNEESVPVDLSGNPLICETDPSGNNMVKADGELHATYTYNDVVYKCDKNNKLITHTDDKDKDKDSNEDKE